MKQKRTKNRARNVELGLLIMVCLITIFGYWLATLGPNTILPVNIVPFLVVVVGLLIGGHFAVRVLIPHADSFLFPLVAFLNGIGYMIITRIDEDSASKQAIWTLLGVLAFLLTVFFLKDVSKLEPYRYLLALLGVLLLLTPLIPGIGRAENGAQIWLRLGPFNMQPGEFAKIVLAAFLASYLADKRDLISLEHYRIGPIGLPSLKYFGPLLFAWGIMILVMIAQRDLGSSLIFFTLFLVMLYVATARVIYVVMGVSLFSAAAYVAWLNFDHVKQRVRILVNPFDGLDPDGQQTVFADGNQIAQAWFALADGGVDGLGVGSGTPKSIPFVETDMIFAAIGEELGLLGATSILVAFLLFVSSGVRVALSAGSQFETLLSLGLTFLLGFQAFIIIGGTLRVLPLTGVTLPFVSRGGSSLIANYVILGILMRISHNSVIKAATNALEREG